MNVRLYLYLFVGPSSLERLGKVTSRHVKCPTDMYNIPKDVSGCIYRGHIPDPEPISNKKIPLLKCSSKLKTDHRPAQQINPPPKMVCFMCHTGDRPNVERQNTNPHGTNIQNINIIGETTIEAWQETRANPGWGRINRPGTFPLVTI